MKDSSLVPGLCQKYKHPTLNIAILPLVFVSLLVSFFFEGPTEQVDLELIVFLPQPHKSLYMSTLT